MESFKTKRKQCFDDVTGYFEANERVTACQTSAVEFLKCGKCQFQLVCITPKLSVDYMYLHAGLCNNNQSRATV